MRSWTVASYAKYTALSERLRALGLSEDTAPGAPLCPWRRDDLVVDVMPVDEKILGFSNRWYPLSCCPIGQARHDAASSQIAFDSSVLSEPTVCGDSAL